MSINVIRTVGELPAAVTYIQVVEVGEDRVELRAADAVLADAHKIGDEWMADIKTLTARNLPRFVLDNRDEVIDALHQIGALYFDMRTGALS
ncbi:Uncharacterised protein [Mycobacteroides abscessus subsp. abscessus]|uniref:hypothetical protein n=1 Tax=Mycobacteroides abscessus TaxID=36809 RepID=UPI00092C5F6F|nr:hypothetical protein [Mycobacteroides abscessus]SII19264.1 Uncharacterised protein [Mycobacteroides abscessus subsp. abscessus]SII32587.1 Uncharacterised protein [Mycobacteroides abscessus subsp. abscessus]SII64541.1 Uncharacterised protein [Mycobacteroides abscessus subsp. abscessus]